MSLAEKLTDFDPNGVGNTSGNIFGLPFDVDESALVVIPVPWDVTVSNQEGTSRAPGLIYKHSSQIDLYDPFATNAWEKGIAMDETDDWLVQMNKKARATASRVIAFLEEGGRLESDVGMKDFLTDVNRACQQMVDLVETKSQACLLNGQLPLILGGDHSTSLGLFKSLATSHPGFGILQIDAHADLRKSYQGFVHSHASVMRNAMALEGLGTLVQVGIREFCDEEMQYIEDHPTKIFSFTDRDIHQQLFHGKNWDAICNDIVGALPQCVHVSFDIDGLDPVFCPNTGTPVPGGLSYNQAMYLLEALVKSGRKIVGADLVETGSDDFDAMMAVRILYRLAGMMIKSQ